MNLGRREFLFTAGLTPLVMTPKAFALSDPDKVGFSKPGVPIVQTLTDESSAQFNVMIDPLLMPIYRVLTSDRRELPVVTLKRIVNPFDQTNAFDQLLVEGLDIGRDYTLEVRVGPKAVKFDERTFRALDTRPRATRFAVVSCMADVLDVFQGPMWRALQASQPGYIFFIGDTCYADILTDGSVKGFWKRNVQTRRALDVFRWKRLIPIMSTWDDHDYAGNNADRTHPMRAHSLGVFKALWGWTPRGASSEGPGVSTSVDLCGQRFYLMDDRYFRDPRQTPGGKHWGVEQNAWLLKGLASSPTPAWIMNGSQVFAGYLGSENFESDHPEDLKEMTYAFQSIEAPIVFGSGDVHYSEVMKIEKAQLGYETFELTSSSIHSATWPGMNAKKNPRRLVTNWQLNFLIVDSYPTPNGKIGFKTWSVGGGNHTLFKYEGEVRRT